MQAVFTVNELAKRWRISIRVIYEELAQGKLKGFKVGGAWRVTSKAVDDYENRPGGVEHIVIKKDFNFRRIV